MRHKTLFSLLVLTGSTAALAHMAPLQTDPPLQNDLVNEAEPMPETTPPDTTAPETWSNATDVEPSAEPEDPTDGGTDAPDEMPEPR